MLSQDKLNTLNQANQLLNSKHAKLGLKPMLLSGTSPEMFRAALERKLSERVIEDNRSAREEINQRILQIADDYQEAIAEIKAPTKSERTNYLPLIIVSSLILAVLAGIVFMAYSWWATSLKQPSISNTIVVSSSDRPLIISLGIFSKRSEARTMQKEVERITGDKVRIVKSNGYYTLQIGDSYKNREDAYLLFEELIKYPLRDLAIRSI